MGSGALHHGWKSTRFTSETGQLMYHTIILKKVFKGHIIAWEMEIRKFNLQMEITNFIQTDYFLVLLMEGENK